MTTPTRLGPYEILGLLGAGGMGQVYRANDPRLHREVALKILPASATLDSDRQRRFAQEAIAASKLNHPNILTVYDVGTEQGVLFLVSELIDGTSLRELMQRGPVSVRELLELGVQIAEGLAAAHDASIVHRDLKPENVMVTRDLRVKLIDFGLALVHDTDRAESLTPDQRSTRTDATLILGTVPYMSPEQARGDRVDFRSDQFALGLILYELAGGVHAFPRETPVQTLSAIIADDPRPLAELNPNAPAPLRWLIERCLAKEPRRRYAATVDLAHDLHTLRDRLTEASSASLAVTPPASRRWRTAAIVSLLLLLLAVGGLVAGAVALAPGADVGSYRLTPFATDPGYQGAPAWSPDGKTIAYLAQVDGIVQVFTRSLGSSMSAQITHARFHCRGPFWSPDGARIFYTSLARDKDGLWSVSAAGGQAELVMENVSHAAISPDGKTLALLREEVFLRGGGERLWLSSPPGADPRKYDQSSIETAVYSDVEIRFSPDGSRLGMWGVPLWTHGVMSFWIVPLAGHAPYLTPTAFSHLPDNPIPFSWLPDNRHIVSAIAQQHTPGTHLWLVDTKTGTAGSITSTSANENVPAVSPDGGTVAFASEQIDFDLIEVPLDGSPPRPLLATSRNELDPAWSPVAPQYVFVTDRTGNQQIWLRSSNDQWERPLVTEREFSAGSTFFFSAPTFSPDGQRIAYSRQGPEGYRIWMSTLAGGPPVRLSPDETIQDAPTWSPDGNWIAYMSGGSGSYVLMKAASGAGAQPVLIKEDIAPSAQVLWSPHGDWIACETADGLSLVSPDGKVTRPLSDEAWLVYGWAADGARVYGIKESDDQRHLVLASIDIESGRERTLTSNLGPVPLVARPIRGFSRMSDKSFATSIVRVASEIWLLEDFKPHPGFFDRFWPTSRLSRR